jgi:hypothetical protein
MQFISNHTGYLLIEFFFLLTFFYIKNRHQTMVKAFVAGMAALAAAMPAHAAIGHASCRLSGEVTALDCAAMRSLVCGRFFFFFFFFF